ncbi:cytochrome P460 family protein [Shewanella gaetbuli]|uniref:Cytochrome P460 family protein n=1 Tax=Shewanella gaetbuli TaxID=220752 RepID=A0A9X2CI40_9GAMM|nr:cytochrome P460 family protein [Shewanella gaetbuli]MCL1144183.1 cytochrome P460 family protein [Shewanella gaetbuli]
MKPIITTALSAIVYTLLAFSSVSNAAEPSSNTPYEVPSFDFLHKHIPSSENYQKQWHRMTGFEHSGLHWGLFVVIYTDIGQNVYKHNFLQYSAWFDDPDDEENEPHYQQYPVGTQFIKENYTMHNGKPGDAHSVTIMIKRQPGYNPKGGDWEYMQFNSQGETIIQGSGVEENVNQLCANCHEKIAERDYIFSNIFSGASQ